MLVTISVTFLHPAARSLCCGLAVESSLPSPKSQLNRVMEPLPGIEVLVKAEFIDTQPSVLEVVNRAFGEQCMDTVCTMESLTPFESVATNLT